MEPNKVNAYPLVSVIIPCYNHGSYLEEAFESIRKQNFPSVEIIVVDDGSSDNTREVSERNQGVKYVYQDNQGLSAARNTGFKHSKGDFLIFLDADDWLIDNAIMTNVEYLLKNEKLAFVSGAHDKVFVDTGKIREEFQEVNSNHYQNLLEGNYIGMHATVMYRRSVFAEFSYDTTLKACEDYDLYLKITRKYPVIHHSRKIAAYRLHSANMSGNISLMLSTVLKVLDRQEGFLQSDEERKSLKRGRAIWKEYYTIELYEKLISQKKPFSKEAVSFFFKYQPSIGLKYLKKQFLHA